MKLAFCKTSVCKYNVEIFVFDDDLVETICDEIRNAYAKLKSFKNVDIGYDYGINLGSPRTIRVETFFKREDEFYFWENVKEKLLNKDIMLKETNIFYY